MLIEEAAELPVESARTTATTTIQQSEQSAASTSSEPETGLFAGYKRRRIISPSTSSVTDQLEQYFKMCDDDPCDSDCLEFWSNRRDKLPILYELAVKFLSVPATSAPVERVFSHGGIILRPHRARLGDAMLSDLVFLKCNRLNRK